jgi:hypothetical protein
MADDDILGSITQINTSNWLTEEEKQAKQTPTPSQSEEGTKYILYRLYNKQGDLLFVSKTTNFQRVVSESWWTTVVRIQLEHYSSPEDLSKAKIAAILEEKPKWNSRVTG